MDNKVLQLFHDGSSVVIKKVKLNEVNISNELMLVMFAFFLIFSSWHYRYLILHDAVMQFYPTERKKTSYNI